MVLFLIDWRLALVALAIVPPLALVAALLRYRMRGAFRDSRVEIARLNDELTARFEARDADLELKFAVLHVTKPLRRAAQVLARPDWKARSSVSDVGMFSSVFAGRLVEDDRTPG